MSRHSLTAVIALGLIAGASAHAAQPAAYLYEAVKTDAALAAEFKRVTQPLPTGSSWIRNFGTTTPATTEQIDGKTYDIYSGCKPHDCPSETYALMYDRQNQRIVAGAFVQNRYNGPVLSESHILWLEQPDIDKARALSKHLY